MQTVAGILLTLLGAATAPVDVHVSLSPPEIPFYRQATLSIQVEAPADLDVKLPDMHDKIGELKVYGEPGEKSELLKNGRRRTVVTYFLDAVKAGDYPIQPVEVTWGKDGRSATAAPALRVRDLTAEEQADLERFESIVLPAAPRSVMRSWVAWTIGAALLAVLAVVLAIRFLLRRRSRIVAESVRSPWEVARERLRALDQQGGVASSDFYIELSDIVRHYIEDRFQLRAPERTTPEFLAEAAGSGLFDSDHQQLLSRVLRHADYVKFARHEPSHAEMEEDFNEVRRFVEETVPKAALSSGEAAA